MTVPLAPRAPGLRARPLCEHVAGPDWRVMRDLTYVALDGQVITANGDSEHRPGFVTDFASVPRVASAVINSVAGWLVGMAIIHDYAYRVLVGALGRMSYQRADAILREGLRLAGAPAVARGLVWAAVRLAGLTVRGRAGWVGTGPLEVLTVLALTVIGLPLVVLPPWMALPLLFVYEAIAWPLVALVDRRRGRYVNPPTRLVTRTRPDRETP